MHNVEHNYRRSVMRRIVVYAIMTIVSLATTAVLMYVALGYGFDARSGDVVRSGLLLVNSTVPDATALFNNTNATTLPSRGITKTGDYAILIQAEGYHDWQKTVSVRLSEVSDVRYPLLVPKKLQPVVLQESAAIDYASVSPTAQRLLTHSSGSSVFNLVTLSAENFESQVLAASELPLTGSAEVAAYQVVNWHPSGNFLVLKVSFKPDSTIQTDQYVSYDVEKPQRSRNLTTSYPGVDFSTAGYFSKDDSRLLALAGGEERRLELFNLDDASSPRPLMVVANQVTDFKAYHEKMIIFGKLTEDGAARVGLSSGQADDRLVMLPRLPQAPNSDSSGLLFDYGEYDNKSYAVVGRLGGSSAVLYQNPFEHPNPGRQLPLHSFQASRLGARALQQLSFSPNGRFTLVNWGASDQAEQTQLSSFDSEYLRRYNFSLPASSPLELRWLSGFHLSYATQVGGQTNQWLSDFDGANLAAVANEAGSFLPSLSQDQRWLFYLKTDGDLSQIRVNQLLIEK